MKLLPILAAAVALCAAPAHAYDDGFGKLIFGKNSIHAPGSSFGFTGWFKLVDRSPQDNDQNIFGSSISADDNGIRLAYATTGDLLFGLDRGGSTMLRTIAEGSSLKDGWNWLVLSYNDAAGVLVTCVNAECSQAPFHLAGAKRVRSNRNLYFGADGMGDNPPVGGNAVRDGVFYLDPATVSISVSYGSIVLKSGGLSLAEAKRLTAAAIR